jgi:hypothetical protein
MSSLRRILTAPHANGRHGPLARCAVLENESSSGFDVIMTDHLARLGLLDGVELGLVEDMVAAFWRTRRSMAIETQILNSAIDRQPEPSRAAPHRCRLHRTCRRHHSPAALPLPEPPLPLPPAARRITKRTQLAPRPLGATPPCASARTIALSFAGILKFTPKTNENNEAMKSILYPAPPRSRNGTLMRPFAFWLLTPDF